MLAQLLEKHRYCPIAAPYAAASRETIGRLETAGVRMACILEIGGSPPHLRYTIRRLRQKLPGSSIIVGLWSATDSALTDQGGRAQIGADYYARSLQEVVDLCIQANCQDEDPQSRFSAARRDDHMGGKIKDALIKTNPDANARVAQLWARPFPICSKQRY